MTTAVATMQEQGLEKETMEAMQAVRDAQDQVSTARVFLNNRM